MSLPASKPLLRETPLLRFLKDCHARFTREDEGEVASYIPELAKANPDHFGIAVATLDGHVYETGDTRVPFTIQSISKAFVFALALDEVGAEKVEAMIGVEPSGEAFNSIRLRPDNRPFNPMINTGAIACCGLIAHRAGAEAFDHIHHMLGRFAGRPLEVDDAVFQSERATGDRNRAIAYLLRTYGGVEGDVDAVLDVYFRQCAVLVTAGDLAVMGATLANHGVNPLTGDEVISTYAVARTLAVMTTAGMYDFAGEWIYRVGLPAKSGVGGGILAALPSQLGLGVFSPRLDAHGNSVRGIGTCEAMSEAFDLHMLSRRDDARASVVADYDFGTVPPRPGRQSHQQAILSARSKAIRVLELSGKLSFASMDYVSRRLADPAKLPEFLILNLHRVLTVTDAGMRLLTDMLAHQMPGTTTVVIAGIDHSSPVWRQAMELKARGLAVRVFPTYEAAVEWAEDQVVYRHGGLSGVTQKEELARQGLLSGLDAEDVAALAALGKTVSYDAGTRLLSQEAPPERVYFLLSGMASARAADMRLSTLIPGMSFGELALIAEPAATDVVSDSAVTVMELSVEAFSIYKSSHPQAGERIVQNLAILLANRLRMATARIAMLTG